MQALFVADGPLFVPTDLTRGGWADDGQHGSPPSGLLARAIEMIPTAVPMQVARFTIDLFRAVPLTPLGVDTSIIRQGKRIQVVEARLTADGVEVGRAVALRIRVEEVADGGEFVETAEDKPLLPGPEELKRLEWKGHFGERDDLLRFHLDAIEIRTIDDSFVRPVPGESWFRLLVSLVEEEKVTPFQRLATIADLANGNSQALDPRRWLYVNPDTTLYMQRPPGGEWIGMRSVVRQSPTGIGVTETAVFDTNGHIGHISQAQLLDRR